jgi:hypothetical protein
MDRHGRQARLAEVGPEGQERIARSEGVVPCEGLAGMVAVRYLAGAGMRRLRVASEGVARHARAVDPSVATELDPAVVDPGRPSPFALRDATADSVARGAHAALAALRHALGMRP